MLKRFEVNSELPECYVKILSEVSKNIAAAGILQPTRNETIKYLRQYCLREIDIRENSNQAILKLLSSELPAIFPTLLEIVSFEESDFLPRDLSQIILKLILIRTNTFKNSTPRYQEDYIKYDKVCDNPTKFFPTFKKLFYEKLYEVNRNLDSDGCQKLFGNNSKFVDGLFSIGCCCEFGIT